VDDGESDVLFPWDEPGGLPLTDLNNPPLSFPFYYPKALVFLEMGCFFSNFSLFSEMFEPLWEDRGW